MNGSQTEQEHPSQSPTLDEFAGLSSAQILSKLQAFYGENWFKKEYYSRSRIHYDVAYVGPRLTKPTKYNQMVKEKLSSATPYLLDKTNSEEQGQLVLLLFKAELYDLARQVINQGTIDVNLALKQCDEYTEYCQNGPYIEDIIHDLLGKGAILPYGAVLTNIVRKILTKVYHLECNYLTETEQDSALATLNFYLPLLNENPQHQHMLEKELISEMCKYKSYKVGIFAAIVDVGFVSKRFSQFFNHIKEHKQDEGYIQKATLLEAIAAFPDYIELLFGDKKESICFTNRELSWHTFLGIEPDKLAKAMQVAIHHPKASTMLSRHLSQLTSFSLVKKNVGADRWEKVAEKFLSWMPPIKLDKKIVPRIIEAKEDEKSSSLGLTDIFHYLNEGKPTYSVKDIYYFFDKETDKAWQFLRLQGRTILLRNAQGALLAIKVQKNEETIEQLDQEMRALQNSKRLKTESYVPQPMSVNYFVDILEWLKPHVAQESSSRFSELVGKRTAHAVFIYQVSTENAHYFTYLDEPGLSDMVFQAVNRKAVADLCQALAQGIVYPRQLDVRGTGLTGLNTSVLLSDLLQNNKKINYDDDLFFKKYHNKTGNVLVANILAEYQYALFLIAGKRGIELDTQARREGKSADEIFAIWTSLASQIVNNCAQMLSYFSTLTETQASNFLLTMINVSRLARQMQFWITDEYLSSISHHTIPEGIYEPTAKITLSEDKAKTASADLHIDFSSDHEEADLKSIEPIKEANKLICWMVNTITLMYNQHRKTYEDLTKIAFEIEPEKRKALYETSFSHLPKKEYHGLMFALSKKRLQTESLPIAEQKVLFEQALQHKKEYQVSLLQRIWRNRSKPETNARACSSQEVAADVALQELNQASLQSVGLLPSN